VPVLQQETLSLVLVIERERRQAKEDKQSEESKIFFPNGIHS
jgi:hypothetical protein